MHPASRSIQYFGVYITVIGALLLVAPGLLLAPLGLPTPTEIWIRVLGAVTLPLGYYYWVCGSTDTVVFIRASIRGRLIFAAMCALLVALAAAPWQLLVFAAIDVAGALWTWTGLRSAS